MKVFDKRVLAMGVFPGVFWDRAALAVAALLG